MNPEHDEKKIGLGKEEVKKGTALLHQQMWCWGCDIRRPEGNLLLTYGFTRERPPEGVLGSSAYSLHRPDGRGMGLWGFGLFATQEGEGSLFLKRYEFAPRLSSLTTLPTTIWTLAQLPPLRLPQTEEEASFLQRLFRDLLLEISRYERRVRETRGEAYREGCLKDWQQRVCPAQRMAEDWERFALLSEQ
jgi:hypothetical protein